MYPRRTFVTSLGAVLAAVFLVAGPARAASPGTVLKNFGTGKCMGISSSYAGDWNCTWTRGNDQNWLWGDVTFFTPFFSVSVVHDGVTYTASPAWFFQYQNARYSGQCLAVSGGSTDSGTRMRIWPCAADPSSNLNELWTAVRWDWMPDGTYYVVNYWSGLVAGVVGGSGANGAAVVQYNVLDHADQWWYYDANS